MRTSKLIHIVSCHAEAEVGNVIVGGVPPPPGDTLWEQSRWIATDGRLRQFVLNEPRGGVFKHINLLVPPKHPQAAYGFVIMEPEHTPPMSGSNSMCVATVLLQPPELQPDPIMIDEPELGLHPLALGLLAEMVRRASDARRVIVSTQSADLVSEFEPEDVVVANRRNGESVFERLESDQLKDWLENYTVGDLWKANVVGGGPAR